jgi:predicted metalloendopeptidase
VGRKYVERYFPPLAKARAQELVRNELAAMKETIEGLDWMGAETKTKALEKLATFNPKIGYPDKWKDYSTVKISGESFWANLAAARRFNVDDDRSLIGKPTDRARWGMTPPTSNAYYNPLLNEIVFPAGILQPPGFDPEAVDAVNYGAIGVVIGHEISHGFDDQGAQYDALGRLSNWWTDADLKSFQQRTQCVVDQFEGYFIEPSIHHNGKLVLGEAIGDLAGARIAYRALEKAVAAPLTPGDEERLLRREAVARRRDPPRDAAADGAGRPPPDSEVSRRRTALQRARVPEGVQLPGERAHGPAEGTALPGLVARGTTAQWPTPNRLAPPRRSRSRPSSPSASACSPSRAWCPSC